MMPQVSFSAWVKSTKITDDAVGDFVADARAGEFPKVTKLTSLKRYLRNRCACENAIEAAEKAWRRWEGEKAR
jgi:hypothetical protein